jgi:hypothetical protein
MITNDGGLLLSPPEVIFCCQHRNIEYPHPNWLSDTAKENPELFIQSAALEALRVPGNKVVISNSSRPIEFEVSNESWALRWSSDAHPNNDQPDSEVKIFHSEESFCPDELFQWSLFVTENGRIAEALVVDDEQSVVTYRLSPGDPNGDMPCPTVRELQLIGARDPIGTEGGGAYFHSNVDWPCEMIGIPLHDGRIVDSIELEIILKIYEMDSECDLAEYTTDSPVTEYGLSDSASLLLDLWIRGLNTRPGFKYGSSWRCYPGHVGDGHAPWLVVDPSMDSRGSSPRTWAEACLSSRLASGVNKHWICPFIENGNWGFLEVSRPPSDSRWSNPIRR